MMNKLVLFLHGYGANGSDLLGLKDYINDKNGKILFESPNAPEPCPINYFGYQWFDLIERTPQEIYKGLIKSFISLDTMIKDLKNKHKVNFKDLVLVGFSQGAMLASYYGLKTKNNLAGIISLSGGLPNSILNELKEINVNQNYLIFHGRSDSVVPYERSEQLTQYLNNKKITNELIIQEDHDHGISEEAIENMKVKINQWL